MPFATRIVPMPHWSTPLGCTKFFLTIVVLAFIIACTAIWGWFPAFGVTIFSATLSLLAFGYYIASISFRPRLYNKWVVLSLEAILTILWFNSLILLAGWTGASSAISQYYYTLDPYPTPYGGPYDGSYGSGSSVGLDGRSLDRSDILEHSWEPFRSLGRRQKVVDVPRTLVKVPGMEARYAAQILAGISAGLAGVIFIMYAVTLSTFTLNFNSNTSEGTHHSSPTSTHHNDEEIQLQTVPPRHSNANTNVNPPTPTSLAITTSLDISSLPKDFEPEPQKQEFYLSPAEATEAGIEPPTAVLRALRVEKEQEQDLGMDMEKGKKKTLDTEGDSEGTSEKHEQSGNEDKGEGRSEIASVHKRDVTRDDGRVEREV